MSKKTVLLVTYGGGHVNMIVPLYRELLKHPALEPKILALTTAVHTLKRLEIPYCTLGEFLNRWNDTEAREYGEKFAAIHHNPDSGLAYEDTVAYFGLGYRDLVAQQGTQRAEYLFDLLGRVAFLPVETMERIMREVGASGVIATTSPRYEAAAYLAARRLGIPSLRVEDLFASIAPGFVQNKDLLDPSLFAPQADRIAVLSDYVREAAVARGATEEQVVVTGQPAFEQMLILTHEERSRLRETLNIPERAPVIMWATQNTPTRFTLLRAFASIATRHPDWVMIAKIHPNESSEIYQTEMPADAPVRIVRDLPSQQVLNIADCVVTEYSTVGLEALLLDRPLVVANFTDEPDVLPYAEMGAAERATDEQELELCLEHVLTDATLQARLRQAREQFHRIVTSSKKPSERIVEEMHNLIQGND